MRLSSLLNSPGISSTNFIQSKLHKMVLNSCLVFNCLTMLHPLESIHTTYHLIRLTCPELPLCSLATAAIDYLISFGIVCLIYQA